MLRYHNLRTTVVHKTKRTSFCDHVQSPCNIIGGSYGVLHSRRNTARWQVESQFMPQTRAHAHMHTQTHPHST